MTDKLYINELGDDDMGTEVWPFKTQQGSTGEKIITSNQILVVFDENSSDYSIINDMWKSIGNEYDISKVFNTIDEFNSVIERINTTKNVNIDVEKNFKIYTFEELLKNEGLFL